MQLSPVSSVTFLLAQLVLSSCDGESESESSSSSFYNRRHRQTDQIVKDCAGSADMTICDPTAGGICRNQTCVSACSTRFYKPCKCPEEEDKFCYLCCGSTTHSCKPAQDYHIYKPNGEIWERDSCSRCRSWPNGLSCDDRDSKRVCSNGKCVANICHGRPEGSYCDLRKDKICTDGECRDMCKEIASTLMTCECDEQSDDRCQLCCYDPSTKRCENAYQKYSIKNKDKRPVFRDGLICRRGLTCNKYGLCSGATFGLSHLLFVICLAITFCLIERFENL